MNYWDSIFNDGAIWAFYPAESAILASKYFHQHNISTILIPGVGYGRNCDPFIAKGMELTGIEISQKAIETARLNNLTFPIIHGSVLNMPFSSTKYNGIYCYSLLHLFNRSERKTFLQNCYNQLTPKGKMIFVVVSTNTPMFGEGKLLSKNRYGMNNGLNVFYYTPSAIEKEFGVTGLIDYKEIDEPIKHLDNYPPLKCYYIICDKG